ncbi:MAG: 6-phosphogluconolactonase [Sphingomonadales bacterium]|nr:6-phosphogluconolactonase [Sphingomonadales bacterium]
MSQSEIEWWDYDDAEEMIGAVAGDVRFVIESALETRGDAIIALPGGDAMHAIFDRLAEAQLPWKRVMILPTDDRLVPMGDDLSNVTAMARSFMAQGARVYPITSDAADDVAAAGRAADARLRDLGWPLDLVLLNVGVDGDVASIHPGADFDAAVDPKGDARAIGVTPDPMPVDAPVARVTLTLSAMTAARTLTLVVRGQKTRDLVERAIADGAASATPVGKLLAAATVPIDIHFMA